MARPSSGALTRMAALVATLLVALPTVSPAQTIGPDITLSELGSFNKWGTLFGITAYSFTTVTCNIGDDIAMWVETTDEHPVFAYQAYRVEEGRIEQIGLSWVKHGFCAVDDFDCGPCQPTGSCDTYGVACSDTYGSTLNGLQGGLGPRSEVDASTGIFPYPFSTIDETGPLLYKRMQLRDSALSPGVHPTARYFYESVIIVRDEVPWGTQFNNASYREFAVGPYAGGYDLDPTGDTVEGLPAIYAWADLDPAVEITEVDVPEDGRFVMGGRAEEVGPGQWRYDYAVYNLNSHRSAGRFSVSLPAGATVTDATFSGVSYHSGEPYDDTDWTATISGDRIEWATTPFATDENANALRFATLYSFSFLCDVAPDVSNVDLGLFRPGTAGDPQVQLVGPGVSACTPFVRGNMNGDGVVDISDSVYLLAFLFQFGAEPMPVAEAGDVNADGGTDISDAVYLLNFLFSFGPPPPAPFPTPGC